MLPLLSVLFAAWACLHLAAASLVYTDSHLANLETRQTANCTDLSAIASTTCWDELKISDYLTEWNRTVPICQATGGDASNCCQPQEPWTTCYLRLAYGKPGSDCTTLRCALAQLSPNLDPGIASKAGYVVRNIVTINSLFSAYYEALKGGDEPQSTNVLQILGGNGIGAVLNTDNEVGAVLNNGNVLKALLAGLPFWGTSSVLAGGPQQINPNISSAAAQAFSQSLQNTKAVSSILFGTPYNVNDHMATDTSLANETTCTTTMLESALSLIMSDVPTFNSWAANGLYSGSTSFALPTPAAGITSAFTTYLVGEALSQSHFSATPMTGTLDKEIFQFSRTCTTLGDVCKADNGKAYYWSLVTQVQYAINEPGNWARMSGKNPVIEQLGYEASAYGLLEYIETSDVYMPVLFDGAYNCTLEGRAGGSAVNIDAGGSLDVACLSSLPMYLSKGSSCPASATQVGGKCPFGFIG